MGWFWPSLRRPCGPAHINGSEWMSPLDLRTIKIELNPINRGLHGWASPAHISKYIILFFQKKKINAIYNKVIYHISFLIETYYINYYTLNKSHVFVRINNTKESMQK